MKVTILYCTLPLQFFLLVTFYKKILKKNHEIDSKIWFTKATPPPPMNLDISDANQKLGHPMCDGGIVTLCITMYFMAY